MFYWRIRKHTVYFCVYENVKRFDFLRFSSSSQSDLIRCWSLISQLVQWCVAGPYVMGSTETDVNTSKRVSVKSGGGYVFSSVNTTSLTFTHVFYFNALTWLVISFFFFRTIYVTTESMFCEFCSFVECCTGVMYRSGWNTQKMLSRVAGSGFTHTDLWCILWTLNMSSLNTRLHV